VARAGAAGQVGGRAPGYEILLGVLLQTPYAEGSPYRTQAEPMSEDCLYLNVWTAAKSANERRPVKVWIYGGALTRGSASLPTYDGAELLA
jgi:para-nitrobenzyl esterase